MGVVFLAQVFLIGGFWLASYYETPIWLLFMTIVIAVLGLSYVVADVTSRYALEPLSVLWKAILHITPGHTDMPAPEPENLQIGREQITGLVMQVYQFASQETARNMADTEHRKAVIQSATIVSLFPLPLFVINKAQLVTNISDLALDFCQLSSAEIMGKPIFDSLNLSFLSNEETLENWIDDCQKTKVTATSYWRQVRVHPKDSPSPKQVDIAAYYNKDNPSGAEFIITMFDRTKEYNLDDQNLDFISIAVHELRTPLTVLRGYIEVFEEEFSGKLSPELNDFMRKMQSSVKSLTNFVNNILNVARIEQNQLVLQLQEAQWPETLKHMIDDLQLFASVHNKVIELNIDPGLPTVAIDRTSIYEVVTNLVDNAIKYSGQQQKIIIHAGMNQNGLVETTVQDFGVGIPVAVLPTLFEKFSRSHRTKASIGGTGLGLYLSKAIMTAHGGDIWVTSKEGRGSIFGFTVQPYAQLADELKTGNKDIVRQAHGWIKNHSLYRR